MPTFALRRVGGPLLEPVTDHGWESRAVFNPGTVRQGDAIHMLYRAVEGDNFSTIGYARLGPDGAVMERRSEPVIVRELDMEKRGCEDPRIVHFEDRYLVFYTAYDGHNPAADEHTRVIMAETTDFRAYRKLGMVGPDVRDKDAMIFPDRVEGRVAYLHRILPAIQIAYFDDLEHLLHPEPDYWPDHLAHIERHTVLDRAFEWEALKVGAGPPPIRTDAGWLLIYHGVDRKRVYRAGAALLDARDPRTVLARLPYPILEPERDYERVGDVPNVVFPEGVVEMDGELQVFYGCADKVIAMATGRLSELIEELWKHKVTT